MLMRPVKISFIQKFGFSTVVLMMGFALVYSAEHRPKGMILIPGGTFEMGGDPGLMDGGSQSHGTSYPIHKVTVDPFWMDETEVTNAQFAEFVEATNYVTFAEKPLPKEQVQELKRIAEMQMKQLDRMRQRADPKEREKILETMGRIQTALQASEGAAGAIIFCSPEEEISSPFDYTQWWRIQPGATWRSPEGPGSTWIGREDHPVVNVTRDDAVAYAEWAGKRLPTEAEWERAARGGLDRQPYTWGDTFAPEGKAVWMANIWQGAWPYENSGEDGFVTTAPVRSFPPNPYGLYDISGNVWEITGDLYDPSTYAKRLGRSVINPTGPSPVEVQGRQRVPTFVIRGGSFLCSDSWCRGYQPGSRQSLEADSPANHTGFRCVKDVVD